MSQGNDHSGSKDMDVLQALYQVERADCAAIFGNALVLVGFLLTYLGIATTLYRGVDDPNGYLAPWLPLPALALASYHAVLVRLNSERSHACEVLEYLIVSPLLRTGRLKDALMADLRGSRDTGAWRWRPKGPWKHVPQLRIGVGVGERLTDPDRGALKAALVPYPLLYGASVAFAAWMLTTAWRAPGSGGQWLAIVFGGVYLALVWALVVTYWGMNRRDHRSHADVLKGVLRARTSKGGQSGDDVSDA